MNEDYTKRELDSRFLNLEEKMDTHFEGNAETLSEIKAQVLKTNGRVNWLEKAMWTALGALPLLTVWAGFLTKEILDQKGKAVEVPTAVIQAAVNQAFTNNLKENGYTK